VPRGRPRKDLLLRSAELAGWALGGLEREIAETRTRLSHLMEQAAQLRSRLGKSAPASGEPAAKGKGARKRRKMSAAARKAISDKMKKRWAERKRLLEKAAKKD
jgi:hypothetical protein